jgi:F-type H+/Na+-transporting ATPase subunit beta
MSTATEEQHPAVSPRSSVRRSTPSFPKVTCRRSTTRSIKSEHKGVTIDLVGEVQQHLGGGRVRAIALGSTEGMMRGMEVVDTGKPVTVPVGQSNARPRVQRAR